MPEVEVSPGQIPWPERCCRCGGPEFALRTHSDDVVIRTLLSVTESRKITLDIPVCDRCARAHYWWFGAAIGLGGIGMLILSLPGESPTALNFVMVAYLLAVVAAIVGVRKKPIKILKYDEKSDKLRIRIYHEEVARAVQQPRQAPRPAAPMPRARGS